MRLRDDVLTASPISPEEIERVKKLRDSGAAPAAPKPVPREIRRPADEHRERMNGREQAGLYSLGGANELLAQNVPDGLGKRLRKLGLWWRYQGLIRQLRNIQEAVQDTADKDQIRTIALRCRHVNIFVGMDRVGDPDGTWVRIPDLNTLMGAVLNDTCGLCVKTSAEADHCELRRALRAMTTISNREISPARNGCIFKSMTVMEQVESEELL